MQWINQARMWRAPRGESAMQQVMITTRGKFSAVGSDTNKQQWGKAQAAAAMQCSDHARGPSLLQQL